MVKTYKLVVTNFALAILLLCSCGTVRAKQGAKSKAAAATVPQWSVHELTLAATRGYDNPYKEADVSATFTGPGGVKQTVRGFWDGGNAFKIRFTPTKRGTWSYVTASDDPGLNAKSGSFACTAPAKNARGFLRRDRANPYHFVFDDGARYFMFGTTYYGVMPNALAGDKWKEAVVNSRAYGMNKVRMSAYPNRRSELDSTTRASSEIADDGYERPVIKHWQKLDDVVRFMAERDVLADLILFSRGGTNTGSEEQHQRYLRYVVARYAAYPNVMWCLINEWNYANKPIAYWNMLGELTRKEDPYHNEDGLIRATSIHQQTRHDFQFFDRDWMSHAIVQLGVRNQGATFRDGNEWDANNSVAEGRTLQNGDEWGNLSIVFNWGHNMPVVNDEYGYIGEPEDRSVPKDADGKFIRFTREKHRHTMWGIYAAAGYAAAGDKNRYEDGRPYMNVTWHDTPEYTDIKHLIDFYTTKGIEYWKLAPNNATVKEGKRVYVANEPGRQYVVYAAQGGRFTLGLPDGDYLARRFDPRTGADVPLEAVKGGTHTFTMPDAQDWVVYLMGRNAPVRARRGR